MSKTTTGAIEAFNNEENRFGIKVDGDWYNGFGDLPEEFQEKNKVVEVTYETNKNNGKTYRNVDDPEDDIEAVDMGSDDGDESAPSQQEAQENMSRQKPIEAVGMMYQGCPPSSAEELNQMKVILKELTSFSRDGEFMVDAQELEGSNGDLKDKVNDLAESVGRIEQEFTQFEDDITSAQKDIEDKITERLDEIEDRVDELDDSEQEAIFDEDDDEPEDGDDADEFTDPSEDDDEQEDEE